MTGMCSKIVTLNNSWVAYHFNDDKPVSSYSITVTLW